MFFMTDCKCCNTLMCANMQFSAHCIDLLPEAAEYRQLVDFLQYLNFTRPDIANVVHRIA